MHRNRSIVTLNVALMLVIALGLFVFNVGSAAAKPFANTTVCDDSGANPACFAHTSWSPSFTVHGITTTVELSAPNYSGSDYFLKDIVVKNGLSTVIVGESSNINCGQSVDFFYSANGITRCFLANTNDYNLDAVFKIGYFVSNGGGWFITITGKNNIYCNACPVSDSNSSVSINSVSYEQTLGNPSFGGHAIWGSDWVNNQFFDGSGWLFDGQNGDMTGAQATTTLTNDVNTFSHSNLGSGTVSSAIPPQMYWNSPPNGSTNNGGSLYTCDYDSTTNSCTIGS